MISGADAVFHLAGENVAQRWNASAKQAIRDSRAIGTANLVAGIAAADPRPGVLVSSSAIGYYGPHGEEPLDEEAPPGRDFLAEVCVEWESAANAARQLGVRVVTIRTGVVLDASGGALGKMLPPFKAGVGGPVAGGAQYMPWIHADDVVGIMVAAAEGENWTGAVNATAPEPLTNRDFSKLLGKVLGRPAVFPVPGFAIRAMYGEMAQIVTTGARVMPAKALVNGYDSSTPPPRARCARRSRTSLRPGAPRAGRGALALDDHAAGPVCSRYVAVGPMPCSPLGAWIVDQ